MFGSIPNSYSISMPTPTSHPSYNYTYSYNRRRSNYHSYVSDNFNYNYNYSHNVYSNFYNTNTSSTPLSVKQLRMHLQQLRRQILSRSIKTQVQSWMLHVEKVVHGFIKLPRRETDDAQFHAWGHETPFCLVARCHHAGPTVRVLTKPHTRTCTTAAELYYLRHGRSCAADASGACSSSSPPNRIPKNGGPCLPNCQLIDSICDAGFITAQFTMNWCMHHCPCDACAG